MYQEGQKSKILCTYCESMQDTTFLIKDYTINNKTIKDLLVGVCDKCGEIVSIPSNSTEKIKEGLK